MPLRHDIRCKFCLLYEIISKYYFAVENAPEAEWNKTSPRRRNSRHSLVDAKRLAGEESRDKPRLIAIFGTAEYCRQSEAGVADIFSTFPPHSNLAQASSTAWSVPSSSASRIRRPMYRLCRRRASRPDKARNSAKASTSSGGRGNRACLAGGKSASSSPLACRAALSRLRCVVVRRVPHVLMASALGHYCSNPLGEPSRVKGTPPSSSMSRASIFSSSHSRSARAVL